jgi:hypothetical protein
MAQLFSDLCRDARRSYGVYGLVWLWLRILPDVFISLVIEHRDSRKEPMMDSTLRLTPGAILVWVMPALVALLLFINPEVLRGESLPYIVAGIIGVGGYALGRAGLIPRLKTWGGYAAGVLLFGGGFLAINVWSPSMNTGIELLRVSSAAAFRFGLHLAVCLAALVVLYRVARRVSMLFRIVVVVLALNLAQWTILHNTPRDAPLIWSATWMLGYSVTALFVAVVGVRLMRRAGTQALMAVAVGLGLQVTFYTIDAYRGTPLIIVMLLGAYIPLILCPTWLLVRQDWRARKYGLLAIWTLMLTGLWAVDLLTWRSPGEALISVQSVQFHLGTSLPVWAALWLAIKMIEQEMPAVDARAEGLLTGAVMMTP